MTVRFDNRVVLITGAGQGLGRAHALAFAARGARVVVNDIDVARGSSSPTKGAHAVVDEIIRGGGEAFAACADITEVSAVASLIDEVIARWGRIDVLVNNAGTLRDASFTKMPLADFRAILEVHVLGTVNCTKAVWEHMRSQQYGRILFTSSSSGLYGNFGQANYGTAKAALIGLMNVLHIEGAKHNVRVNTLVPAAATRMTEALLAPESATLLRPETVSPAALFLCGEDAPSRVIMGAGAGCFSRIHLVESVGIVLAGEMLTPETIADRFDELSSREGEVLITEAWEQTRRFISRALDATRGNDG